MILSSPLATRACAEIASAPRRFIADSKGQIAVLTAYMAPFIFAMAGLAIDIGSWQTAAVSLHGAIDKAAYSAMVAGANGGNGYTAAEAIMAHLGFPCTTAGTPANGTMTCNGAGGYSLTVNNPPKSGSYTSSAGAWEVTATAPTQLFFVRWFLPQSPKVSARSVANGDQGVCILALDNNNNDIHSIFGSQSANVAIDCGVMDNLNNSHGGDTVDVKTQGVLHFSDLSMVEGYSCDPSCQGTLTVDNPIKYHQPAIADPYASRALPVLTASTSCVQPNSTVNSTTTLYPGVYCNGLTITGGTVTLDPGVYIIDGGDLTISGASTIVQGAGVSIILTSRTASTNPSSIGQLSMSNGAQLNITAPSSSIGGVNVAGMAVWQDSRAPIPSGTHAGDPNLFNLNGGTSGLNMIASGSSTAINGVLYFPSEAVVYNGGMSNGGKSCTQIVAYQILFNGAASFKYPPSCPQFGMTPINGSYGIVE